jgi:hypothetical protein
MKKFIQFIIGFGLLAIFGYLLFFIIKKSWVVFSNLNPTIATGILAASATITVSIISVLVSKQIERKTIITNELREKKVPIYEEIIAFIFRITFAEKKGETPLNEKEVIQNMVKFTQDLVIWGSDEVIDSFFQFRTAGVEMKNETPSFEIMFKVEDLLLSIRKDLGHKNKNMKRGKILGLFINDIQNYIKTS